jgi:hypothetical protein
MNSELLGSEQPDPGMGDTSTGGPAAKGSDGSAGKVGPLPFDISVAHQARMYDYALGGYFP